MLHFPSTPQGNHQFGSHKPRRSSPLASPSSSPVSEVQSRRRAQYKSRTPSAPLVPFALHPSRVPVTPTQRRASGVPSSAHSLVRAPGSSPPEPPQTAFLRERLRARCAQHAARARARGVNERRYASMATLSIGGSSDAEMELEDDEDDDDVMADELFRRIIANQKSKRRHNFRMSFVEDVGSSMDPDMEDMNRWEQDLHALTMEPVPEDVDEEELQAYAAEIEAQELAAELEAYADQIFESSDVEENSLNESGGMDTS